MAWIIFYFNCYWRSNFNAYPFKILLTNYFIQALCKVLHIRIWIRCSPCFHRTSLSSERGRQLHWCGSFCVTGAVSRVQRCCGNTVREVREISGGGMYIRLRNLKSSLFHSVPARIQYSSFGYIFFFCHCLLHSLVSNKWINFNFCPP